MTENKIASLREKYDEIIKEIEKYSVEELEELLKED